MVARFRILIAAVLVAVSVPAGSTWSASPDRQEGVVSQKGDASGERSEDARVAAGPMEVYDDVERGWNARDVDPILRHFGAQKVAISVDGTGPSGGTFSKSQSYYLLKDLFRFTVTRKFEFVQFRKASEEGTESFAIAERHYQRRDDGRLIKDKVYVSLHLEREADSERWVVDEIKSIR